jgi:circadian clock protein KaiB
VVIYKLRLYITPRTSNSLRALTNLDALCREELHGQYEVEVIDVTEQPGMAERDKILATPTLVRRLPEPMRKIIGDLSDRAKVLSTLDLLPVREPAKRA